MVGACRNMQPQRSAIPLRQRHTQRPEWVIFHQRHIHHDNRLGDGSQLPSPPSPGVELDDNLIPRTDSTFCAVPTKLPN
jgi:hypothetical protein